MLSELSVSTLRFATFCLLVEAVMIIFEKRLVLQLILIRFLLILLLFNDIKNAEYSDNDWRSDYQCTAFYGETDYLARSCLSV